MSACGSSVVRSGWSLKSLIDPSSLLAAARFVFVWPETEVQAAGISMASVRAE